MLKTISRILLVSLLCLFVFGVATCMAQEPVRIITESELTALEWSLSKLEKINSQQLQELSKLKQQVETLKSQLAESKQELLQAQKSLGNANQSLNKLEKEALSTRKLGIGLGMSDNGVAGMVDYQFNRIFGVWGFLDKNTKAVGLKAAF